MSFLSNIFGELQEQLLQGELFERGRPYLAFDIETSKIIPDPVDDLKAYRPLGIACAATLTHDGKLIRWHGKDGRGKPAPQMSREEAQKLAYYLLESVQKGYIICTWNGLGFDFDILGEESGMVEECKELALNHLDMMFHFFCMKGFGVGLDKVCQGMRIGGKPEGMDGGKAPKMWAEGKYREVLDYVAGDVRSVLEIAQMVDERKTIAWITARGEKRIEPLARWLTGKEAAALPVPDTSWMKNAWTRNKFLGWTGYQPENDSPPTR